MTATIIAFPAALDRDQAEFDRNGTSNLTRALDDAWALHCAVHAKPSCAALASLLHDFADRVAHLARYRDDLPLVVLGDGLQVDLTLLPGVLLAMAGLKLRGSQAHNGGAEVRSLYATAAAV